MESKGKIYWIEDDFTYIGPRLFPDAEITHAVCRVESAIIKEHMIRLVTEPTDFGDGQFYAYNINMLAADTGIKYTGSYSVSENPDEKGKLECELFENSSAYFLHGTWREENDEVKQVFTWFAKVKKL